MSDTNRLFPKITVLENLLVAQHTVLMRASVFSIAGLLGLPSYRRAERAALDKARYWLDRIGLLNRANDGAAHPAADTADDNPERHEIFKEGRTRSSPV